MVKKQKSHKVREGGEREERTVRDLPLEDLQHLWGGMIGRRDPREIGELVELFESGDSLLGYAPDIPLLKDVYTALIKKYDRAFNRWRS